MARLDAPGVTVSQFVAELRIGANVLGRWRRELRREPEQAFVGQDDPCLFFIERHFISLLKKSFMLKTTPLPPEPINLRLSVHPRT